jgi:hypothetical protein
MHIPTSKTPPINNPTLRDAVAEASQRVNSYTDTLDTISADIRNIEKWFDSSGVRLKMQVTLDKSEVSCLPHGTIVMDWDAPEVTDNSQTVETVEWAPMADGRWRLLYREAFHEWTCLELYAVNGDRKITDRQCRPLIETPASVRLRVLPALAELVQAVAAKLPEKDAIGVSLT